MKGTVMKFKTLIPNFVQDLKQDLKTLKTLDGRQKLQFIWDYYKWKILTVITVIVIIINLILILIEGQRPYSLRVCAVLNTEDDCADWFGELEEELKHSGSKYGIDLNQDQPFDYDNVYYYVQELEVMTTISSYRMDVAICGEDLYSYLLALNACMTLDEHLPQELFDTLQSRDMLDYNTANLTIDKNGNTNPADGIDGCYAIRLTETDFYETYNRGNDEPLYAVVISNTEEMDNCLKLVEKIIQ